MHTRKKGSNMHPWVSALFGNLKVIYTHKGACSWISHLLCQSINTWVKKKRAFNIHPHKLGADLNLYFLACTPQTSGLKIKHRRRGVNGVLNSATFNFRGGKGNSSSSASARFIGELFVEIVVRMSCKVIYVNGVFNITLFHVQMLFFTIHKSTAKTNCWKLLIQK